MKPLVSVIINNYNYGLYIQQAIESVLDQTYQNIELIIVDDGSTDESRSIIDNYRDRARVILKENGGQASAFNIGIAAATGDFVLLLDSDDFLFPEAVEAAVEVFPSGYSRIFYRLRFVDENGKQIIIKKTNDQSHLFNGDAIASLTQFNVFPAPPTSANLFSAAKLKAVLPIPEREYRICADLFIYAKTALTGPVRATDRALGAYRIHRKNNFCMGPQLPCERQLKNHVDNIFKSTALLEDACKTAGYDYRYKILERSFSAINTICTAYKIKLDNQYIAKLQSQTLLRHILRYLRYGDLKIFKRIPQSVYLLFVIVSPAALARPLMRLMYAWINR